MSLHLNATASLILLDNCAVYSSFFPLFNTTPAKTKASNHGSLTESCSPCLKSQMPLLSLLHMIDQMLKKESFLFNQAGNFLRHITKQMIMLASYTGKGAEFIDTINKYQTLLLPSNINILSIPRAEKLINLAPPFLILVYVLVKVPKEE